MPLRAAHHGGLRPHEQPGQLADARLVVQVIEDRQRARDPLGADPADRVGRAVAELCLALRRAQRVGGGVERGRGFSRTAAAVRQAQRLLAELQAVSLDIAAASMFSFEAASFGTAMHRMLKGYLTGAGRPAPSDFLLPDGIPTWRSVQRTMFRRRWTRLIGTIITARRRQQPARDARDLFNLIADAHGSGAEDLLADEVATMIVAGYETTALALFWACLMLARMPD